MKLVFAGNLNTHIQSDSQADSTDLTATSLVGFKQSDGLMQGFPSDTEVYDIQSLTLVLSVLVCSC
jgi:hypothetical protein